MPEKTIPNTDAEPTYEKVSMLGRQIYGPLWGRTYTLTENPSGKYSFKHCIDSKEKVIDADASLHSLEILFSTILEKWDKDTIAYPISFPLEVIKEYDAAFSRLFSYAWQAMKGLLEKELADEEKIAAIQSYGVTHTKEEFDAFISRLCPDHACHKTPPSV